MEAAAKQHAHWPNALLSHRYFRGVVPKVGARFAEIIQQNQRSSVPLRGKTGLTKSMG